MCFCTSHAGVEYEDIDLTRYISIIDTVQGDIYCVQNAVLDGEVCNEYLIMIKDATNTEFLYLQRPIDIYALHAFAGGPPSCQWHFDDIIISAFTREAGLIATIIDTSPVR